MAIKCRFHAAASYLKTDGILLFAVALVFSQVSAEIPSRTCHWCGPLAEQVHRSRRAPPCSSTAPDHTTLCDPGLAHCAIVATAPPQVISRYCVKLYQDECYSQFCNTTQTWKMTCPCKGDFCNGDIGEREKEAFILLAKLASKTHTKLKKRMVSAVSGKIVEKENQTNSLILNADHTGNKINVTQMSKIEDNAFMKENTANTSISHIGTQSMVTSEAEKQMNHKFNSLSDEKDKMYPAHNRDPIENEVTIKETKMDVGDKAIKTDKETNAPMEPAENKLDLDKPMMKYNKETNLSKSPETVMVTEPALTTNFETERSAKDEKTKQSVSNIKPTAKLPSESLQQNLTPKPETVEIVTTTDVTNTEIPTTMAVETTTKSKIKKNSSVRNTFKVTPLMISFLLSYFLM